MQGEWALLCIHAWPADEALGRHRACIPDRPCAARDACLAKNMSRGLIGARRVLGCRVPRSAFTGSARTNTPPPKVCYIPLSSAANTTHGDGETPPRNARTASKLFGAISRVDWSASAPVEDLSNTPGSPRPFPSGRDRRLWVAKTNTGGGNRGALFFGQSERCISVVESCRFFASSRPRRKKKTRSPL